MEYGKKFDIIIVGGGTAGSVLASRLSENNNISVLLIEAGGYPPIEAEDFPALFTILLRSKYDYNFIAQNDHRTAQNLQGSGINIAQGKVLGGSGILNRLAYVRGNPHDFNQWARDLCDDSWNYTNLLPYFKKIENLTDEELLATSCAQFHGTTGPIKITRAKNSINIKYLEAFKELGNKIVLDTTCPTSSLGYSEPLYTIADDGLKQSTALKYLGLAKSRTNLCLSLFTTATKILVENGIAIGVQVTTANGDKYNLYAKKEVVISAGAINSPKLLMLSGIGPQSHLKSLGIKVKVDSPVGQIFRDHPTAVVVYQMDKSSAPTPPINPHSYPFSTTFGFVAFNSHQSYPDYQAINIVLPHDSNSLIQICDNSFKYSNKICQKIYDASKNRTILFVIIHLLKPKSYGKLLLKSTDPNDYPLIYPGTYTEPSDLKMMAKSLADFNKVINTKFFKNVNASMVDVGLCSSNKGNKDKFWKCYGRAMSTTNWRYCCTCAMGSVLDTKFRVKGVRALRVVDSSSMPNLISSNLNGAVAMIAERASDLILSAWNIKH